MQLSLFIELDRMTGLAGAVQTDLHQLFLGKSSLVTGLPIPGHRGIVPGSRLLKGITLICLATLFAAPDYMVAPDAWVTPELCLLLTCSVLSPLDLKSLVWVEKEGFCILEGLRPLQIQDQMLMQR